MDPLSDALHREFARSEPPAATFWLLLDPSPLGMQQPDDPGLGALLNDDALARVEPSRALIPVEMSPALLPLDPGPAAGSNRIRLSLSLALDELPSSRLAQGAGRVVAAWLEVEGSVDAAAAALQRHLARVMFARRGADRVEWLRWYDPAVLWLLWPHLDARQQELLLGPIRRYWLLTPSATWACLLKAGVQPASDPAPASLEFTPEQWSVIDGIGPLNQALVQIQSSELDIATCTNAASVGMSALARAQKAGFTDPADLARYAQKAMSCHPGFDRHALVAERLQQRSAGQFFTSVVDDITDPQWDEIAKDLKAADARHP